MITLIIILQTLLSLQNLMMKRNLLTVITVKRLERLPTIHTIPPNIMSLIIFSVSSAKVKMKSLFLFDNGGSLTLSRKRAYYASKSDENPDGYANSREQDERLYQLKEDWSQAINKLLKKKLLITTEKGANTIHKRKNYSL